MDSAPRFRKIKKTLKSQNTPSQSKQINKHQAKSTLLQIAHELYLKRRLKALLVDIFMIYTPIIYLAYVIVGGAQEFRSNQPIIFACFLAYACISAIFIAKSGQTPGLRYVELRIVRADRARSVDSADTSANPESKTFTIGFWQALLREFAWAFSCAIMVGFIAPFVGSHHRKSHQCLHDLWLRTRIIEAPTAPKKPE